MDVKRSGSEYVGCAFVSPPGYEPRLTRENGEVVMRFVRARERPFEPYWCGCEHRTTTTCRCIDAAYGPAPRE